MFIFYDIFWFFKFCFPVFVNPWLRCPSHLGLGLWRLYYTGWPRKNATLSINNFKKTRDRMKILRALLRKMTPRSLILMKAFWFYGRFSEAMSFSRFALLHVHVSHKSQFMYPKFSIVWLPRVKCPLLLCKAKPAWIKRSINYVTLPH